MKKCMSHVWKSHSTHIKESCNTYDAVTLHIWMNHVIDMHESCDTYESVMYLRKEAIEWAVGDECVITHTNESCHTYEWVYSIHTIKSHQTYGWVMSLQKNAIQSAVGDAWVMTHIWMRHVTHANESRHTYESLCTCERTQSNKQSEMHESCHTCKWVMSLMKMSQVTRMNYYVPARGRDRVSGWTQFHYRAPAPGCQSVCVWMSKEPYTAIHLCQSSSTIQCNYRDTLHTCNTLQHTATHLNRALSYSAV